MSNWFEVDKKGLAKLYERKNKAFVLYELISNSWDENVTEVIVTVDPENNVPKVNVSVQDDSPEGFADLRLAWTLFASENRKRSDAETRGRFVLGEKLVLSLCDEARIKTTTGSVIFDATGRKQSKHHTERGSVFEGLLRMTRQEMREMLDGASKLLPPKGKRTVINKVEIPYREPFASFVDTLPTVFADAEGNLHHSKRRTTVHLHRPLPGETATIYELGVPVVEIEGDAFHINVFQKTPLSMDRENVPPGFLRQLRALALNCVHAKMTPDELQATWVTSASTDSRVSKEAVGAMLDARYGQKRVSADPSDAESNKRAVAAGYTVIHGRSLPGEVWEKIREHALVQPAGNVTPGQFQSFSPDGEPLKTIAREQWTDGMKKVVDFYQHMAYVLVDRKISVTVANDLNHKYPATYGDGHLILNKIRLGGAFFEQGISDAVLKLGLHELNHDDSLGGADHLDDVFHDGLCTLAVRFARAVANGKIVLPVDKCLHETYS